jgi:hypothetical protein
VSDFIEQCRREWKRLNVPDPLAEEMAAELASDLNEAEAEGVSAESSSEAVCLIRVRSLPPGPANAGSSPTCRAARVPAEDRSSSRRSLRSQHSE